MGKKEERRRNEEERRRNDRLGSRAIGRPHNEPLGLVREGRSIALISIQRKRTESTLGYFQTKD
jgi:hypothetical protein